MVLCEIQVRRRNKGNSDESEAVFEQVVKVVDQFLSVINEVLRNTMSL